MRFLAENVLAKPRDEGKSAAKATESVLEDIWTSTDEELAQIVAEHEGVAKSVQEITDEYGEDHHARNRSPGGRR